ncbi:uncharacterized protein LOC116609749 isoform X1 [Nematostella vectensis]|uniref:uncharacterized protein LOC116609749 isoform X1 n=1 Tax=Nematostella vectensis TaxID=45351 RepID=UPI0020772770|nr:uncharacterized protein LOC116609749 isoform X1 [Nematostella vectensis]
MTLLLFNKSFLTESDGSDPEDYFKNDSDEEIWNTLDGLSTFNNDNDWSENDYMGDSDEEFWDAMDEPSNDDEDCLLAERHTGRGMEIWRAEDCYMLKKISSWRVQKFKTTSTDYLKVTPQPEGLALLDQLSRVFVTLVSEMTANMQGNDLGRFVLRSNSLDYPISLPFMPRLELNANRIMIEVERVLQSNESVNIEDGMNINIHISMPLGGSPLVKRNIRNLF